MTVNQSNILTWASGGQNMMNKLASVPELVNNCISELLRIKHLFFFIYFYLCSPYITSHNLLGRQQQSIPNFLKFLAKGKRVQTAKEEVKTDMECLKTEHTGYTDYT